MTSQRIGEQMERIRDLLDEIRSEELARRMERLRESLERMDPDQIREALQDIEISAEEMLERLERTAELLERIRREQAMEEVVRDSRALMEAQRTLSEETARPDAIEPERAGKLSHRQEDLAAGTDSLRARMERLAAELAEEDRATADALRSAAGELDPEAGGPQEAMRRAARRIREGRAGEARKEQRRAMERLITLFERTAEAQRGMQMNTGMRMATNLQKYARRTLELSFRQERLARRLRETLPDGAGTDLQEIAARQNDYLRAARRIADEIVALSRKSLMVPPSLTRALGEAIQRMRDAVLLLDPAKPLVSTTHAADAVGALNRATIEMLTAARRCSSAQGRGGGSSLLEQLMQQLVPSQQDLTAQTRRLLEMEALQERLRRERVAEMKRLAGRQRSLEEIARRIEQTMRDDPEALGRLDRLAEEMEAIASDLEGGRLDDGVVDRQQRILSRLLDARRSLHTSDFEPERESRTAADMFSEGGGPRAGDRTVESLRERIRRAMELEAPSEYQELIRLYFRAIAERAAQGARGEEAR